MNDTDIRHVADTDPEAVHLHGEYARRIAMLALYWAGFETAGGSGDALDPTNLDYLDAFTDALGASSVPEACAAVATSVFGHAR